MSNIIKKLVRFRKTAIFKTLRFNFHYFSFRVAIRIPVLISKNVILEELKGSVSINDPIVPGKIKIGFGKVGTIDMLYTKSIWEVKGKVEFYGEAKIGVGTKISVGENGILEVGDGFTISAMSSIIAHKRIRFGRDCLISWDVLCMDTDFHKVISEGEVINSPRDITIGDKVWIGCRTVVLKGSSISDGCVIGASSVVTGKLEMSDSVYVGNPVRLHKTKIKWEY